MPTGQGPMIIDAEIDFFEYIDSQFEGHALRADYIGNKKSNTSFMIPKGGKKRENILSGEAFKGEDSIYYQQYIEGYNFMVDQMKKNKDKFAEMYAEKLKNIGIVRILPIGTNDLVRYLQDYMFDISRDSNIQRISELSSDIKEELCEEAKQNKSKCWFIFNKSNEMKVNIDKAKLEEAITDAFENGTIPAIYADMEGKIFLDNSQFGQVVDRNSGDPVTKNNMIGAMKNHFLNVVKDL